MKVPTYKKYGLTKSEFENVDKKKRKVTHFLTHQLPILIGVISGGIIYFLIADKLSSAGLPEIVQQIFMVLTIIVLATGVIMVILKPINNFYHKILKNKSHSFQKAEKYETDKDKYDFWKLRMDDSFWQFIDGLSVEREILSIYKLSGFNIKSELSTRLNRLDYILTDKNNHSIYLRCYSMKMIEDIKEINDILGILGEIQTNEIHLISVKGFNRKLHFNLPDKRIKLITQKGIVRMLKKALVEKNINIELDTD